MFGFRLGTYVLIFLSLTPGLIMGYEFWQILCIAVAVVIILAAYIIIKPHFYSIEREQGRIFVSTDREDKDEFFLVFTEGEFQDYTIKTSIGGLRKQLLFLKKEGSQYMLSKPLNIGLSLPSHINKIEEVLGPLRKQHGVKL